MKIGVSVQGSFQTKSPNAHSAKQQLRLVPLPLVLIYKTPLSSLFDTFFRNGQDTR